MDPAHRLLLQRLQHAADAVVLAELRALLPTDAAAASLLSGLLWQRHARTMEAFVRRKGRDIADQVLSDLQLRFFRWCYGQLPLGAPSLQPIAYTMAKAALIDALRKRTGAVAFEDYDRPGSDDVLERLASDEVVEALLATLPLRDRRIVEAKLADVSDDELALELDIEVNALYVARHRALGRLRSHIEATG